jgi:hypothetical protein
VKRGRVLTVSVRQSGHPSLITFAKMTVTPAGVKRTLPHISGPVEALHDYWRGIRHPDRIP